MPFIWSIVGTVIKPSSPSSPNSPILFNDLPFKNKYNASTTFAILEKEGSPVEAFTFAYEL